MQADLRALKAEKSRQAFTRGGANDISAGPAGGRRCTDLPCCVVLVVALLGYVLVTLRGLIGGNVDRLYKPRDSAGNYCGIESQWDNGPTSRGSLEGYEYSTMTMNVSATTDAMMKQFMCSKAVQNYLELQIGIGEWTASDMDAYMCACCYTPCSTCSTALKQADPSADGSAAGTSALVSLTAARMTEIAGLGSTDVFNLFSSSGENGDLFSTGVMSSASHYLHSVCMTSCDTSYGKIQAANGSTSAYAFREYIYSPVPSDALKEAWDVVKLEPGSLGSVLNNSFTFKAFSQVDCPYDSVYCVPMPGIAFKESALNYCTLEIAVEVVSQLGSSVADVMASEALTDFSNGATQSLGEQWGAIQASWMAFALTGVASFVIGMLFLVFVRFFVGICVWISIIGIFLLICAFSGLCYIKSIQCAGYTLLEKGQETATQVVTFAAASVSQVASGKLVSEDLLGDGNAYRGVQYLTRYGTACQNWATTSPHIHDYYLSGNYEDQGIGDHNYCRNPYNASDVNKGSTIWCFTVDEELRWQECLPIGLDAPECEEGYAVSGQTARDVLLYACYALLGLAVLWVLVVICFLPKILLAIRCVKVAARFLATTPTVLLVPAVQSIFTILWCIGWAVGAAFLISQVPDGYTPTGWYADYGTAWEACTYDGSGDLGYPVSEVWRDETCAGPSGECWRCQPPRYMLDYYVAYVFFIYLWLNAFVIAAGQCIIAGTVGVWFFNQHKTRRSWIGRVRGALRTSIWNTTRYHMGSLAFGSFIIALVQFIRYCMKFLEKQARVRKNRVMVCVAKAMQCCLYCFEKSLEYLNKLAYIQIALLGKNFCTSAKQAFYLVLRHMVRFAVLLLLGTAIDRIGLLCITAATTFAGYLIQTTLHPEVSPLCPTLLFLLNGYVVGKLYMNVFHLAIDTSLQCFIACEEMGVDSETVPRELRRLVPDAGGKSDDGPLRAASAGPEVADGGPPLPRAERGAWSVEPEPPAEPPCRAQSVERERRIQSL
ncbi:unnamed protein product [Prorocentrum cordatum]|uniref:Kringle domain-containing protein n=1 Tax=Prorocentrum cordatum TaxID=2364126 RepID=A0ABN9S0A4_9DINO|nr:unnamed protein product [Polarella glacialis]